MDNGPILGSHWKGCWRAHHDCAIARIENLQAKLIAIKEELRTVEWYNLCNTVDGLDDTYRRINE